jgi:hypothetical protein
MGQFRAGQQAKEDKPFSMTQRAVRLDCMALAPLAYPETPENFSE